MIFFKKKLDNDPVIGWREWISLPELGLKKIKAKIDTGARTSALHAFRITPYEEHGKPRVSFDIHPLPRRTSKVITCVADVIDQRWISDSGGHREHRYVIKSPLQLGNIIYPIEITLTNRDDMMFRMLIGRTALKKGWRIDPNASYLLTKKRYITT